MGLSGMLLLASVLIVGSASASSRLDVIDLPVGFFPEGITNGDGWIAYVGSLTSEYYTALQQWSWSCQFWSKRHLHVTSHCGAGGCVLWLYSSLPVVTAQATHFFFDSVPEPGGTARGGPRAATFAVEINQRRLQFCCSGLSGVSDM